MLVGAQTQVPTGGLLSEHFPSIDSLREQQRQSLTQPLPLRHLRACNIQSMMRQTRRENETDEGARAASGGEGSSPEDEERKLLNRSRGHLAVDALMVEKGDEANVPLIGPSFGLGESEHLIEFIIWPSR